MTLIGLSSHLRPYLNCYVEQRRLQRTPYFKWKFGTINTWVQMVVGEENSQMPRQHTSFAPVLRSWVPNMSGVHSLRQSKKLNLVNGESRCHRLDSGQSPCRTDIEVVQGLKPQLVGVANRCQSSLVSSLERTEVVWLLALQSDVPIFDAPRRLEWGL